MKRFIVILLVASACSSDKKEAVNNSQNTTAIQKNSVTIKDTTTVTPAHLDSVSDCERATKYNYTYSELDLNYVKKNCLPRIKKIKTDFNSDEEHGRKLIPKQFLEKYIFNLPLSLGVDNNSIIEDDTSLFWFNDYYEYPNFILFTIVVNDESGFATTYGITVDKLTRKIKDAITFYVEGGDGGYAYEETGAWLNDYTLSLMDIETFEGPEKLSIDSVPQKITVTSTGRFYRVVSDGKHYEEAIK